MGMTWADDETGVSVAFGTAKPGKVKPPKPVKAKKAKGGDRPAMPGMPPPRDSAPPGSLLAARPSVPVGLPIVRAPARGTTSDSYTAVHQRLVSKYKSNHRFLRAIGWLFVVVVIAAGGFAAGALTELGTEAETYVLGPTPPPRPTVDPRVGALESEIARLEAELAAAVAALPPVPATAAAASNAAPTDAPVASSDDDDDDRKHKRRKKHRRKSSVIDL